MHPEGDVAGVPAQEEAPVDPRPQQDLRPVALAPFRPGGPSARG
jgi:hypothetical protein